MLSESAADGLIFGELLGRSDREYISELTTYGLQRLEKEPSYLRTEKDRIDDEMQNMTVENLSVFLQTSTTVQESEQLVGDMQKHVDSILSSIPNLSQRAKVFSQRIRHLRTKRKSNRQIIANQMKVLEILELPQLMWKCARSKMYQEALDLKSYADDMLTRHRDSIPILTSIVNEMESTTQYILSELLTSLQKSIQLHDCLKIIGYLRRMNVFEGNELLLRKEFLTRRLNYLQRLIPTPTNNNPNSDKLEMGATEAYTYLCKFMDLYRKHIFAIVTQYRAIFVDDWIGTNMNAITDGDNDAMMADVTTSTSTSTAEGETRELASAKGRRQQSVMTDLCVIWIHERILHILATIDTLLPFVNVGSYLNSIVQTCDYCGMSLGHVGVDFRGLLPPIFERRVISLFDENCSAAVISFSSALTSHDWFVKVDLLAKLKTPTGGDDDDDSSDVDGDVSTDETTTTSAQLLHKWGYSSTGDIRAPQILLQFPPLAVLSNGLIRAFNELNDFVTYTVMSDCKSIVIGAMQSIIETLTKYSVSSHHYHKRGTNVSAIDSGAQQSQQMKQSLDTVLAKLVRILCEDMIPFVCDLFDLIFERRKEIQSESLVTLFSALYTPPAIALGGDDDDGLDDHSREEKHAPSVTINESMEETTTEEKIDESISGHTHTHTMDDTDTNQMIDID